MQIGAFIFMATHNINRVVWTDGLLVEAQHFQQQERYIEHQVNSRLSQITNLGWGFSELEIDQDLLQQGLLAIIRARGIFDDGTPFSIPTCDAIPEALDLSDAPIGTKICLATVRSDVVNSSVGFGEAESAARYKVVEAEIQDANVGLDPEGSPLRIHMQVGQLRTRLCREDHVGANETWQPIARLAARQGNRGIVLDSDFIPAMLDVRAHIRLLAICNEFQGLLQHRLSASAGQRLLASGGGLADLIEMLATQAISEYRMRLDHLEAYDPLHPADLYLELTGLLGRLSVLPSVEPMLAAQKWRYQHDDLQACFSALAHALRRALALIIESPVIPLRFEDRGDQVYLCINDPQWKLQKMVFAFSSAMPGENLRRMLPTQVKFGPVEHINKLVDLQLPGARLVPVSAVPRNLPFYAQSVYFEVESVDPYWKETTRGAAMALRVVGDFPQLKFEAWGLREGKVA